MHLLDKKYNGSPIEYKAIELSEKISTYCLKETKKTKIYQILESSFQDKYLEIYFQKLFYENVFWNISHKIVLNEWEIKNKSNNFTKINIKIFLIEKYLKDYLIKNNVKFVSNIDLNILKIKFFSISKQIKLYFKKKILNLSKNFFLFNESDHKIAVSYSEGINLDNRSDLFFFNKSIIKPDDIILYFEYYSLQNKHQKRKDLLKKINKLGINTVNAWEFDDTSEVEFFTKIIDELKKLNISLPEEKSLLKLSLKLIRDVKFWYLFFKKFNIKIHLDPVDNVQSALKNDGANPIAKKLALGKLDSCSIGKLRSHPEEIKYNGLTYPYDVFFAPSKNSIDRIKKTDNNNFKYSIISGFAYNPFTSNNISEIGEVKQFFKKNNKKFIILLLDNAHDENKNNIVQQMPTHLVYNFYNTLLKKLSKDDDVGIIIKNKRLSHIKNLKGIYPKILELQKKGTCYLVKNPFQKIPNLYASVSDLIIAVSPVYPSALIDSIQSKKPSIFCDLFDLELIEKEFYKFGKNKSIFKNPQDLTNKILQIKNGKTDHNFGDWSNHENIFDPYQDNLGSERIGKYINCLLNGFKNKLSSSDAMLFANNEFIKDWGKDKIF